MKITVVNSFIDAITGEPRFPGDVIEVSDKKRIVAMMDKGLIKPVKVTEETAKKTVKRG